MNTDKNRTSIPDPHPRSSASIRGSSHLLLKVETDAIIGCAFEVLNELGHGLLERPYENALVVEFGLRSIVCEQQRRYDVVYKTVKVGEYVPDLIAFGSVVVDAKVIERITDHELGQMLNHLKITGHPVGLILNFRKARLEWKRVINTNRKGLNRGRTQMNTDKKRTSVPDPHPRSSAFIRGSSGSVRHPCPCGHSKRFIYYLIEVLVALISQSLPLAAADVPAPLVKASQPGAVQAPKAEADAARDQRAADLNLPADFVRRVVNRAIVDDYAGKFYAVVGESNPEPYKPTRRHAPRTRVVRLVRPAVAAEVLAYRLSQERSEDPLRGFRAPILQDAGRLIPVALGSVHITKEQQAAAEIIRRRLAHDGLLLTLAQVLRTLGPEKFRTADEASVARLWEIGFPVDLLAFFRLEPGKSADVRALVSSIAAELAARPGFDEIRSRLSSTQFRFTKSREDFRVATESGEEPLGMLRMQIGGGYEGGIIPGDSIDLASQLVAALPDVNFTLSVPAEHAENLLWLAQNSWPLRRANQVVIVSEPCPITPWAQDNGKAGTVGSASVGPARPAFLAPRFASQGEIGSVFFPGESYLTDGMRDAGIEAIQSPLLFQGGNVMAVREPATGKRILLIGEAEIYRNTALGLMRDQVLEAFRLEFDVAACVVFPTASHHLDIDVSVRVIGNQLVAFVNDTAAAAHLILERGVAGLEAGGAIDAATAAAILEGLEAGNNAGVVEKLTRQLLREKAGQDRYPASLAKAFTRSNTDSPTANLQCFLASLDLLASVVGNEHEVPGDDSRQRYLRSLREVQEVLERQRKVLEGLGWKVVRVPSMPDLFRSINYLNGIHDKSRFILPAFGGFYSPLDEAAIKVFQQEFGPTVKLVPILCGAMQGHHGAVHCVAAAYPKF